MQMSPVLKGLLEWSLGASEGISGPSLCISLNQGKVVVGE